MKHYVFYNQNSNVLYMGYHYSDEEAWEAMWNECKYPEFARNVELDKQRGIYFNTSK